MSTFAEGRMNEGDRVPDLTFATGPTETTSLGVLCPGAGVLVFLRHLA
jgi:hypothetical protein